MTFKSHDTAIENANVKIEVKYNRRADSISLFFSDRKAAYSKKLDPKRAVSFCEDGEIRSIEFLSASSGIDTENLPHKSAIERALSDKGLSELTNRQGDSRLRRDLQKDASDSLAAFWEAQMKARITTFKWSSFAILIFIGFAAVSVLLIRNLLVLDSLLGVLSSLFGLFITLFPTVLGCLILLAWLFYSLDQASHP